MADKTGIEWSDATWNPVVGCTHVSAGCDGCYAAREAAGRLAHLPVYKGLAVKDENGDARFTGEVRILPERLDQPVRWKKGRRIFVNSMSDLFHRDVPEQFIIDVFAVMAMTPRHTYQVLTKRPQRMATVTSRDYFRRDVTTAIRRIFSLDAAFKFDTEGNVWPLPNVWLGTSVEDKRALYRVEHLRHVDAAIRFLSIEPLIEALDAETIDFRGVDWIIVGGESGPKARPMAKSWVLPIRDRCVEADLPFLFKQWGEWLPLEDRYDLDLPEAQREWRRVSTGLSVPSDTVSPAERGDVMVRVGKKNAGRVLDGRTWDQYPG